MRPMQLGFYFTGQGTEQLLIYCDLRYRVTVTVAAMHGNAQCQLGRLSVKTL